MGLKIFFDDWNHQYQLEIIPVYHDVQNEKKHVSKRRDIEFGDENNFETDNGSENWNHQYQLEIIGAYHNYIK